MKVEKLIEEYINTQPEQKRAEMQELHNHILTLLPGSKLWFETEKNSDGKTVSNPNVGYGSYTINYANGTSKELYKIGISANTTGISLYIMGIKDKKYLVETYRKELGKASVTGYCIKFKTLKDMNIDVLKSAIKYGG